MNITHVSDLHANLHPLSAVYWPTDLWVFTGDIFHNFNPHDRDTEARMQRNWFRHHANHFLAAIGKTPVLVVDGNHDFACLADEMRTVGIEAHDVTMRAWQFGGHGFAGFGHIPYIAGTWAGEVDDATLDRLSVRALASGADVLVTHCPPAGILSANFGNVPLAARLKGEHGVKTHLFGHVHEHAGEDVTIGPTRFYNGALGARLVIL